MTQLPPDFKDFLRLLNSQNVEYLLVGGYAVGYYGYPRATGDMDIWVRTSQDNAERLTRALRSFGFSPASVPVELFTQRKKVIRMGVPPVRIEVLTDVSGVEFDECYGKRVMATIDDVEVSLICLEHLKRNKQAAGRSKDLNDLENLP